MNYTRSVFRLLSSGTLLLCLSCHAQNTAIVNDDKNTSTDKPVAYNIHTGEMQPENLQPKEKIINLRNGKSKNVVPNAKNVIIQSNITQGLNQEIKKSKASKTIDTKYPKYDAALINAINTTKETSLSIIITPSSNLSDVESKYLKSLLSNINVQKFDDTEFWYANASVERLKQLANSHMFKQVRLEPKVSVPTLPPALEANADAIANAGTGYQQTENAVQEDQAQRIASTITSQNLDLLNQLSKNSPTKNVAFSTYSLDQVGKAALLAMPKPLSVKRPSWLLTGLTPQSLNQTSSPLLASYQNHNQLFYRKGDTINPEYAARYRQIFAGTILPLDFADAKTATDKANQLVSEQTKGLISEIFKPESFERNDAILSNILYFKANWQSPFDAQKTKLMPFTDAAGKSKPVPTMMQEFEIFHATHNDWKYVGIPFADGSTLQLFLTPKKQASAVPSQNVVMNLLKTSQEQKVMLQLPKLNLQGDNLILNELAPEISKWQLPSLIANKLLKNPEMIHKSVITWGEKGAEAAALSAVMASKSLSLPPTVAVNRPFVFMIRQGSDVMFTGAVRELEAVE